MPLVAVGSNMLREDHSHSHFKIRLWSVLTFFVLTISLQDAVKINKSCIYAY